MQQTTAKSSNGNTARELRALKTAPALPENIFIGTTVLGEGPTPNKWMFIGEAPGYEEDRSGRPFVGPSGKFLNALLSYYTEIRRPDVYITNVVKVRPPDNRTPKVGEVKPYRAFLHWELAMVQPDIVVTLGVVAGREFIKGLKIKADHGLAVRVDIPGVWSGIVVPWFHPEFALRSPEIRLQAIIDAEHLGSEVERMGAPEEVFDYSFVDESTVTSDLLRSWGLIGLDTETTSPTRGKIFATDEARMVGYSVSRAPRSGYYVEASELGDGMAGIVGSPLWTKVCHNAKFEYKIFRQQDVTMVNYEDTKIAAYLLGESRTGLKDLSRRYLGVKPIGIKELWPEGMANQPRDVASRKYADNYEYGAADADNTLRLWPVLHKRLVEHDLLDTYAREKLLMPVLAEMETRGMGVDLDKCAAVAERLGAYSLGKLQDAQKICGNDVSLTSTDQLSAFLEAKHAPLKKRTKGKNQLVVDAPTLNEIRDWWPELINPLLDFRKYLKLASYVKNFQVLVGSDGRLHTSFNQAGHWEEDGSDSKSAPSTGRLSSSGPNLMNIPHHRATVDGVDWGKEIRGCLIPSEGNVLMSVDLGQEEPRIVAIIASDTTLMDGFSNGRDIYRPATEALYPNTYANGLSDGDWAHEFEYQRFVGKTFFLAWYYGAGANRLKSLDKDLTTEDISRSLAMLEAAHPAREVYLDSIRDTLLQSAVVQSLYGRKRWFYKAWLATKRKPTDRWPRGKLWEDAVREAANMRVQATAADILKIAMPRIDRGLRDGRYLGRLVSTVHDEVVLDLPQGEVSRVYDLVANTFEPLLPGLPLIVEAKVGSDWGNLERI